MEEGIGKPLLLISCLEHPMAGLPWVSWLDGTLFSSLARLHQELIAKTLPPDESLELCNAYNTNQCGKQHFKMKTWVAERIWVMLLFSLSLEQKSSEWVWNPNPWFLFVSPFIPQGIFTQSAEPHDSFQPWSYIWSHADESPRGDSGCYDEYQVSEYCGWDSHWALWEGKRLQKPSWKIGHLLKKKINLQS